MQIENQELLKKLQEFGVIFCVSVPSQWGQKTHIAKPEELLHLIKDP